MLGKAHLIVDHSEKASIKVFTGLQLNIQRWPRELIITLSLVFSEGEGPHVQEKNLAGDKTAEHILLT